MERTARQPFRRLAWTTLRVGAAAVLLALTVRALPMGQIATALRRLDAWAFLASVALLAATNLIGGIRWRLALRAFGASALPPYAEQVRLCFISTFFNTWVPGAVGGDVLRAGITHRALGNASAAWLSVLTERVMGLAALAMMSGALVGLVTPIAGVRAWWLLGIGMGLFAVCLAAPLALRPIARRYRLGEPVALPLLGTWGASLFGHVQIAAAGQLLARSVAPDVAWPDTLVVVPLAQAATYFPATVGGLGVREAAFVGLYGALGVSATDAGAVALAFLGANLVASGLGGAVHAFVPAIRED